MGKLFTIQDGIELNLGGAVHVIATGAPFTAPEFTGAEINSFLVGSLWVDSLSSRLLLRKYTNNNASDWVEVGTNELGPSGLMKSVDFVVQQVGTTAGYTAWAAGSPPATESFLNGDTSSIFIGNGTATPTLYKASVDLDGLRLAVLDQGNIFIGHFSAGITTDPDPLSGSLNAYDFFFCKDDLDGKSAMYYWNGLNLIKYADPDWKYGNHLQVSSVPAGSISVDINYGITTQMSIAEALMNHDMKFGQYLYKDFAVLNTTNYNNLLVLATSSNTSFFYSMRVIIRSGHSAINTYVIDGVCTNSAGVLSSEFSIRSQCHVGNLNITPEFSDESIGTTFTFKVRATDYASGTYNITTLLEKLDTV